MELLEAKTVRVNIDRTNCYATPLLRIHKCPNLQAPKESVMPLLPQTERHLVRIPELAKTYASEIEKLVQAGYVVKLTPEQI